MIGAAILTSSLCLLALASARLAVVLRSRQRGAPRLSGPRRGGDRGRRRPSLSVTIAAVCLAATTGGALLGGLRLALLVAAAVPATGEVVRRSRRSRAARRYEAALPAALEDI